MNKMTAPPQFHFMPFVVSVRKPSLNKPVIILVIAAVSSRLKRLGPYGLRDNRDTWSAKARRDSETLQFIFTPFEANKTRRTAR
jgi:hypothetical protein